MLPILILDGAKVLKWNPVVWVITTGIALIMVAYPYIISYMKLTI
jgi:Zn-dependent protease